MNSLFAGLLLGSALTRDWRPVVLSDEERAHAARMFDHLQPVTVQGTEAVGRLYLRERPK